MADKFHQRNLSSLGSILELAKFMYKMHLAGGYYSILIALGKS